eukprot:g40734.t1
MLQAATQEFYRLKFDIEPFKEVLGQVTSNLVQGGIKVQAVSSGLGRTLEWEGQEPAVVVMVHMENCVQFWLLDYQKDMIALERAQRRFIRILPQMKRVSYEERLDTIGQVQSGEYYKHLKDKHVASERKDLAASCIKRDRVFDKLMALK